MRKTVKYFYPGQTITLFDCYKNEDFNGVLYINPTFSGQSQTIKRLSLLYLIISLIGIISLTLPFITVNINSSLQKLQVKKVETASPVPQIPVGIPIEKTMVNENNDFKIMIPKIELESDIIPNVDTTSEEIYKQKLLAGVAHANGSYFPGQDGMVFLFAHSTDSIARILEYNAKFMFVYQLDIGDEVQINYKGKLYRYAITDKKIINPQEVELVRQANSDLVLSTCWPLGTNWQRLILFADSTAG